MNIRLMIVTAISLLVVPSAQAQGDVSRGAEAFRQCAACHSLDPGYHLTGPSLFGVIGRPAGKAKGFRRYSEALKVAEFSWTLKALDQWLENPDKLVPGTSMRIRPIADASMRQDIIAFLKSSQSSELDNKRKSGMPDLKQVPPAKQVTGLKYCPDAYQISVATGNTFTIWEYNLRFKVDSSSHGPLKGKPVLVGQGMQGDRSQIIFAMPAEISSFIRRECTDD